MIRVSSDLRSRWAAHLASWLEEWAWDRALKRDAPSVAPPAPGPGIRYDRPPRTGEVWLLHPGSARVPRPVYVAILETDGSRRARVAPFSRFSIPAFEGELRMSRIRGPLRVLAMGFARTVSPTALSGGWKAGILTPKERGWVAAWPAPDRCPGWDPALAPRLGPPLAHPRDPRLVYVREEQEWMDAWASPYPVPAGMAPLSRCVCESDGVLDRAAEPGSPGRQYRTRRDR